MDTERTPHVEELLRAMVHLVATWNRVDTKARVAEEVGIELPETDVQALYLLGMAGGTLRPSELANALEASRPTTSKVIARLIAAGVATRETGETDGRSATIVLTEQGRTAFLALDTVGYERVHDAVTDMPIDEIDHLTQVMRHLATQFSVSGNTESTPRKGNSH